MTARRASTTADPSETAEAPAPGEPVAEATTAAPAAPAEEPAEVTDEEVAKRVAAYQRATEAEAEAQSALTKAIEAAARARDALGAALVPEKAQMGAEFNVWVPAFNGKPRQLITIRKTGADTFKVRPWSRLNGAPDRA